MKILVIDIETRPNLAHVWGLWDQRVGLNQIVEVGTVICFAAKWHKSSKVEFASDYHDGHDAMVKRAWTLLDDADAVVHYNGKAFDMKHLQREFLLAGLPPPSPWVDIDLLLTVRQQFKFASNKLDHIASELGIGTKMAHEGFDLWRKCMADDKAAWGRMKRYNVQDVRLTETLYDRLMSWIKSTQTVRSTTPGPTLARSVAGRLCTLAEHTRPRPGRTGVSSVRTAGVGAPRHRQSYIRTQESSREGNHDVQRRRACRRVHRGLATA